jgi:hypothetical protein
MIVRSRSRSVPAAVVALALSLGLVAGACSSGSSDDVGQDNGGAITGTVPSTTRDQPTTTTTTAKEVPGTPDEASIPGAVVYVDPQGLYTLEEAPEWDEQTGSGVVPAGIELWYVGTGTAGFRDNINVLEQQVGGADLQAYLDKSIAGMGPDLQVIDSGIATGAYGQELGYVEYKGMVSTAPIPVHVFATFAIVDGTAILATLTTTEDTAAQAEDSIAQYLTTLNPTGGGTGGNA